jgi:hypothetical protein
MNQETLPIQYLVRRKISGEFLSANRAESVSFQSQLTRRANASSMSTNDIRQRELIDYQKSYYEAGELLALEGSEFLDTAYRTVLKRAPDPAGIRHYSKLLELGINPRFIIEALRYSEEGEQAGVQINGIRSRVKFTCLSMPLMRLRMRRANR